MEQIASLIQRVLANVTDEEGNVKDSIQAEVVMEVKKLCERFPLYVNKINF